MQTEPRGVKLVFGTMTFAGQVDKTQAIQLLNVFFDFHPKGEPVELDAAFMYQNTLTEKLLGQILTKEQRSRLKIATKANPGHKGGLSAASVTTQLETSLKNLKMESVDIFYLHWPDPKTPIADTLKACDDLHKRGLFRELGLSNYSAKTVEEIYELCETNDWIKPTVYQGMYNVLTRAVEDELIPLLRRLSIRFYVYNPLAGGLLTGKYSNMDDVPIESSRFDSTTVQGKRYQQRFWKPSYFKAIEIIKAAAAKHCPTKTIADICLMWLHHHSCLRRKHDDAIIIGQSSLEHLKTNLRTGSQLTQQLVQVRIQEEVMDTDNTLASSSEIFDPDTREMHVDGHHVEQREIVQQRISAESLPREMLEALDQAWAACQSDCPPYHR